MGTRARRAQPEDRPVERIGRAHSLRRQERAQRQQLGTAVEGVRRVPGFQLRRAHRYDDLLCDRPIVFQQPARWRSVVQHRCSRSHPLPSDTSRAPYPLRPAYASLSSSALSLRSSAARRARCAARFRGAASVTTFRAPLGRCTGRRCSSASVMRLVARGSAALC